MKTSRSITKYAQVSEVLSDRVRAGYYDKSGLPGERELAAEFGVARVTIRTALAHLEDHGLVTRRARHGTLPTTGDSRQAPRRLLRDVVDQFLDRGRVDQRQVVAFGFVKASPDAATALSLAPGSRVLRALRLRSIDGRPMTFSESFVPEHVGSGVTRKALVRRPYMQVLEALGITVGDAEQIVSARGAPSDVAKFLELEPGAPVLHLHRIVYDQRFVPIQFLIGWYRPDRFDVAMRLSRHEDTTRVWVRALDSV